MRSLLVWLLAAAITGSPAGAGTLQGIQASPFGPVVLVSHADKPKGLVVLFAEEPPRQPTRLAGALADLDYAVAQAPPGPWLASLSSGNRRSCVDIAAAILTLERQVIASNRNIAADPPIVVGAGSGAALAYLAAAQSLPDQLHAVVSLDFRPVAPAGMTPCHDESRATRPDGPSRTILEPLPHLNAPWFVFQTETALNQGNPPAGTFLSRVPDARLTAIKGRPDRHTTVRHCRNSWHSCSGSIRAYLIRWPAPRRWPACRSRRCRHKNQAMTVWW